jgi:glycosyltransferase involved in cell wall biosynthesis
MTISLERKQGEKVIVFPALVRRLRSLVRPARPFALAEGMMRLVGDSELGRRLDREKRPQIERHFSTEVIAAGWKEHYRHLL